MNLQDNKTLVQDLLTAYSHALNSSNAEALTALYAADGVFMPDGAPALWGPDKIRRSAEQFLAQKQINIDFEVTDVTVDGEYAFVLATSRCTVHQQSTNKGENTECRDFFVLRNEQQQWMVYRYMFSVIKDY
jgi:uncharacterized protein (TIGR02246 family)